MGKKVAWVAINGGMSACAVAGLFYKVEAATNVLLFSGWAATVCTVLVMFCKSAQEDLRKRGPTVPRWIAVCNDAFLVVALASVGRFALAGGILLQIMVETSVYAQPSNEE